jgi:tetratricopeptide (TPR) repeat protein
MLRRALECRARCDYGGALAALAEAEDATSLIERSRLHEDFGDYGAAARDAAQAVALAEGTSLTASALARLAAVARAQRRPREAERILEDVFGPEALVERAAALEELARLDEAEELFRAAASDDPRVRIAEPRSLRRGRARAADCDRGGEGGLRRQLS